MGLAQGLMSFELVIIGLMVVVVVGVSILKNHSDKKIEELYN